MNANSIFSMRIPTNIIFGCGELKRLATEKLPGKKAMIVISSGNSMKKYGYLDKVITYLNENNQTGSIVFDKIMPNPIKSHVMEAAAICREEKCDFVIGLGGGSSNGATALAAINELCSQRLSDGILEDLAAQLGSDCPLFLTGTPVVMRGRGESVYPLFGDAQDYISRLKILLFKPDFSINTGWAYAQMRANPSDYIDRDFAEGKISEWLENPSITGIPLINNMQIEAFKKYPALEIAIEEIKSQFGVPTMMSGSGSACFAIVNNLDGEKLEELKQKIKSLLGDSCFIAEAW